MSELGINGDSLFNKIGALAAMAIGLACVTVGAMLGVLMIISNFG